MDEPSPFTYDGGRVDPGERADFRYTVSETYLGDAVRLPVSVVNGGRPGPTVFLSAAAHGDELNGVEVVREVAHEWDHADLHGTLVCLPVLNVPGFVSQQRYLPVYDRDLNRAFPGAVDSTGAKRIAHRIFHNFVAPCDLGIDLHTSTRGRTNMLHVRADLSDPAVERVAKSFAANVVVSSEGPDGSLRREASAAGIPTITVEMGEAHRFQRPFIDQALAGVLSVFAEYGLFPDEPVSWPGWRTTITGDEKTWLRADVGGIVEMHYDRGAFVPEGATVCTITDPFKARTREVSAPFPGLMLGVLENPLVYPGNPICHLVHLDERARRAMTTAAGAAAGD